MINKLIFASFLAFVTPLFSFAQDIKDIVSQVKKKIELVSDY